MEKQEIETIIDTLDQATLALRFYVATKQQKYLEELKILVDKLHQLIEEKGVRV